MNHILGKFLNVPNDYSVKPFGSGLIHKTFLVSKNDKPEFILQEINHTVFKDPLSISSNIDLLEKFNKANNPDFIFPSFLKTLEGESYAFENEKPYRLSVFIQGSHSIDVCEKAEQAYEAAFQFGKFSAQFNNFDIEKLKPTIPGFHDLQWRWQQFEQAMQNRNNVRINFAKKELEWLHQNKNIVATFLKINNDHRFIKRVTHHDTKISNVLFNQNHKGICVIDLDTTMPGYFISDLGDMFRTYLSIASEEETAFDNIQARPEFYNALVQGYLDAMGNLMTDEERSMLNFAGEFMIYMQSLRFMTDFINNDKYYGAKYELHNFNRGKNQQFLLDSFRSII